MIDAALVGQPADTALVNEILELGRPVKCLQFDNVAAKFVVVERNRDLSAASLLAPVAVALVQLLTGSALERIRQCEAHNCTLLFLDSTKSGRRRWCSMSSCGNRMKVSAFRSRKSAEHVGK